jgi:tyrosyl-tRNA synthetase
VNGYAEKLLEQFGKVLLDENLEIRRNSEWLAGLDMYGLLELTSSATVAQMLERADFAKRYETGVPISMMEFLYPLMQGYDSVAVEADVELGGSDQLWNLMMGRVVQERYGQEPQVALTVPLLVGTDGTNKMSQSLDNYIGVDDHSADMFGKTMSIPDDAMPEWLRLAADLDDERVSEIEEGLASGVLHPNDVKRQLARSIVHLYHGESAAEAAEEEFNRVFRESGVPDEIYVFTLPDDDPVQLPGLMRDAFGISGSEARRLLAQGAVKLDDQVVEDNEIAREGLAGKVLKIGKRRFVRLGP